MDYTSTGSFSNINKAQSAFLNTYGYSSATIDNFNESATKNELFNNRRPVYMRGDDSNGGGGHAWVCDGAHEYLNTNGYCFVEFLTGYGGSNPGYSDRGYWTVSNPTLAYTTNATSLYFNMNWGFRDIENGWFISNNVNSGDGNFKNDRKNMYVIP